MKSYISNIKKFATVILCAIVVSSLCVPAAAYATFMPGMPSLKKLTKTVSDDSLGPKVATSTTTEGSVSTATTNSTLDKTPATNCRATLNYYSVINYQDSNEPIDESNATLLGTQEVSGLTAGFTLSAWDYVADIDNLVFFSASPESLTISTTPSQNVVNYYYFQQNNTYTVNYYLMQGADLTAKDWKGALAPSTVKFIKLGSETFDNQPFGELVEGDAYEYKMDGAYVVDSYPPEIRVGSQADNNVLNILYVPESEVKQALGNNKDEATTTPDASTDNNASTPTQTPTQSPAQTPAPQAPSNSPATNQEGIQGPISAAQGNVLQPSGAKLPEDQTFEPTEMAAVFPGNMNEDEAKQAFRDFVGAEENIENAQLAQDIKTKRISPEEAKAMAAAYKMGIEKGQQIDQGAFFGNEITLVAVIAGLLILTMLGFGLFLYQRNKCD